MTKTFEVGDRCRVNAKGPGDYEGREGRITEVGPGESEYRVEFEDGEQPTTGYLTSSWLERVPDGS